MMTDELHVIAETLGRAKTPEEVFGPLDGTAEEQLEALGKVYRRLARLTHPDGHGAATEALASDTFADLSRQYEAARAAIGRGTYGKGALSSSVTFATRRGSYVVTDLIARGDTANIYRCSSADGEERVLKLVRDPADNDLMMNAALHLRQLDKAVDNEKLRRYAPLLLDSFITAEPGGRRRQAHVLQATDGHVSLDAIHAAYPHGLDPRDMAWIWRRLLTGVGSFPEAGISHAAVLPPHVLVHPIRHSMRIVGWCHAVALKGRVSAIPKAWRHWYPAEVFSHDDVDPTLDIYMAACCMIYMLGGSVFEDGWALPDTVPTQFRAYFRGIAVKDRDRRPHDAWDLIGEFDELIQRLWGPRRYRPLAMPT